jgi:hypothetical protein
MEDKLFAILELAQGNLDCTSFLKSSNSNTDNLPSDSEQFLKDWMLRLCSILEKRLERESVKFIGKIVEKPLRKAEASADSRILYGIDGVYRKASPIFMKYWEKACLEPLRSKVDLKYLFILPFNPAYPTSTYRNFSRDLSIQYEVTSELCFCISNCHLISELFIWSSQECRQSSNNGRGRWDFIS